VRRAAPTFVHNMLLDDTVKSDAALSADCLAEGEKWINKNAADTAHKDNDAQQ
jgi:hypothetical protein